MLTRGGLNCSGVAKRGILFHRSAIFVFQRKEIMMCRAGPRQSVSNPAQMVRMFSREIKQSSKEKTAHNFIHICIKRASSGRGKIGPGVIKLICSPFYKIVFLPPFPIFPLSWLPVSLSKSFLSLPNAYDCLFHPPPHPSPREALSENVQKNVISDNDIRHYSETLFNQLVTHTYRRCHLHFPYNIHIARP